MSSMPSSCRRNSDWMACQSAGSAPAMVWESENIRREVPERMKILSEAVDDRSVLSDGEVRDAQLVEPREPRFAPFQHRDRRGAAREDARRRLHRHRLEAVCRASRARVEHVAVAYAVHLDETLIVTARGDRTGGHGECREQLVVTPRMLDAHAPGSAPGLRAEDGEVAGEVHHCARHAEIGHHARGAIDGVLLAESAEVELHAGKREVYVRVRDFDLVPAHQRKDRIELGLRRDARLLEIPGLAQDTGRGVE